MDFPYCGWGLIENNELTLLSHNKSVPTQNGYQN